MILKLILIQLSRYPRKFQMHLNSFRFFVVSINPFLAINLKNPKKRTIKGFWIIYVLIETHNNLKYPSKETVIWKCFSFARIFIVPFYVSCMIFISTCWMDYLLVISHIVHFLILSMEKPYIPTHLFEKNK